MSEFKFSEQIAITSEIPRYSAADIQVSKQDEMVDVPSEEMIVEKMWENSQPISEDDIKASALRDELVRGRYGESSATIDTIKTFADIFHTNTTNDSLAAIGLRQAEFSEYETLERAKAQLNIAAIETQLQINLQHAAIDTEMRIEDLKNTIQDADKLLDSNNRAIANLNRAIEEAVKLLAQHEHRRTLATRTINALIAEYEQKQAALLVSQSGLITFQNALYNTEARRDELMDQKSEIKTDERNERNALVEPFLLALRIDNALDDVLSDAVKELIRNKKQNVTSLKLSKIMGALAEVQEEQKRNAYNLNNNEALVAATILTIEQTNDRLDAIPPLLEHQRQLLAYELEKVASDHERYSTDTVVETETFYAINKGDTTEVSKDAISSVLTPVWTSMKALQTTQTRSAETYQVSALQDPEYTTSFLLPLLDFADNPVDINEISEMVKNRETLSRDLDLINNAGLIGKIGRTVFKAGEILKYKAKPTIDKKD